MQVIDLTKLKDHVRVFKNATDTNINPKGTWIIYHEGDYSDKIGTKPIGRMAMDFMKSGRVRLFQKVIENSPRRYIYIAEVI